MVKFIMKIWEKRVVRFLVVGCFNTGLDITLLLLFYKVIGLPELVANTLSVSIAVSISYFLNHQIVFRYRESFSLKNYLRFLVATGFSIIVIQDITIYVVTHKLWLISDAATVVLFGHHFFLKTLELLIAKLSAVIIGMIWNFLLYKYVIFRHQSQPDEADELTIV